MVGSPVMDWGLRTLGDGVVRDDMSLRLPGYTSHGPVVPRESHDPGAVVRSTTEDWEARAAAADRAAELLQEALELIADVVQGNCFGRVIEGETMYKKASRSINVWRQVLVNRQDDSSRLVEECRIAGSRFHSEDAVAASDIVGIQT